MKSVILCEGSDDLWFISYFLHKTAGWNIDEHVKDHWSNYKIPILNHHQKTNYIVNDTSFSVIWSVAGKDQFKQALDSLYNKILQDYPQDPIESIVLVCDHDDEDVNAKLSEISGWLPTNYRVTSNLRPITSTHEIDGYSVDVRFTPIIVPYDECGAIESILINSVQTGKEHGATIVSRANEYINGLLSNPDIVSSYFPHKRLMIKAKFSAVIAAINPTHSTEQFKGLMLSCPWEDSEYINRHFTIILELIR